ncbi:MAG: M60 family peptidase N-terminal accessory domain-containing protein [Pseudomonadota bacterium]
MSALLVLPLAAQAQLATFEFDNSLDSAEGVQGEFLFEEQETSMVPTFESTGDGAALYLAPQETVRYPASLTADLLANGAFTIRSRFKVSDLDGPHREVGYIWSVQPSRSWCSEGFTLLWWSNDDGRHRLVFRYGDDCDAPFWDDNITIGIIEADEWVDMEIVVDMNEGVMRFVVDGNFIQRPFNSEALIENIREATPNHDMFLGWYAGTYWPHNPHNGAVTFDSLILDNNLPPPDGDRYRDAVIALTDHLEGTRTLTEEQRDGYALDISLNASGQYLRHREATDAFMAAFEARNAPLFNLPWAQNINEWSPETRALYLIQQEIHDNVFVQGELQALAGLRFEAADSFPGPVAASAPRVRDAIVEVDATFAADPAVFYPADESGALRPTGYYVPPGEIVRVKIDPAWRNLGLKVVVGAHRADISRRLPNIKRFPRVSKTYELNQANVGVANPFGGALYIEVPPGVDLGWIPITIDKAVKAPYFRYLPGRETDLAEWRADVASRHVPWADFESEHMMFTWPAVIGDYHQDPAEAMALWDQFWEGVAVMLGRDFSKKKTEYTILDRQLPWGSFSAGYPVPFSDGSAPANSEFNPIATFEASPLNITNPSWYRDAAIPEIMLHEMGHNMRWPTLGPEVEAIAQMPYVGGFAGGLGLDIDEAFTYSADPDQDRDQAAMDWIMTHNFRDDAEMGCDPTIPGDACHELRYQHRGYAKYVDIAVLFGWDKLGAANRVIYDRWLSEGGIDFSYAKEFVDNDEYLRAVADSLRVNPMPLFHFWGVRGSSELEAELAQLPPSPEIYERLMHYRSIVPRTKAGFQPWYDHSRPRVDPVHHDRYDWALANWDSEQLGQKALQQIDRVISTWYPDNFDPDAEPFALNAGLNDAWYNPVTAGQGVFVNVFPELGKVFIAMFTFDEGGAAEGASATLGGPGQRWLTAIGDFTGNRVELDVGYTTGGVFDSATPAPNTVGGQGTLVLTFGSCSSGSLRYDLPGAGVSGTIPLERVVKDNEALCEALRDGSVSAQERASLPTVTGNGFVMNPGMNDAWFNPATAGQGVLMTVFPGSDQLFLAKFTFDTEPGTGDAVIGGAGQRWFTAIGPITGNRATLDVANTTGGAFDTAVQSQTTTTGQGTVTVEFGDCASATLDYELQADEASDSMSGSIDLQRVVSENAALCEALNN